MKKTFNRILAATVAIPVALGQILAISTSAATDANANVTLKQILNVTPDTNFPQEVVDGNTIEFTQISTWNEYIQEKLEKAEGKEITVDAKAIVGSLNVTNYYASLIKDIVAASANPTATVNGSTITIKGEANLASYVAPELEEKFASMEGYEDVTIDTSVLEGVTYTATIAADLSDKLAKLSMTFNAGGKDYTLSTASDYMDVVYDNLVAQVEAAVDQKVADLAEKYGMTKEEVLANADFDIAGDVAALKEVTDKTAAQIDKLVEKLDKAKNVNFGKKEYDSVNAALVAAKNYALKNGIASAANMPTTVDGMVAKIGGTFDKAVSALNTGLTDADVNVNIAVSAADIASVLNGATAVTAIGKDGKVGAEITIEDAEKAAVEAYVEAEVAKLYTDKEVESVETEKLMQVAFDANSAIAGFDVVRNVVVTLKDKETSETTTAETTDETGETTTEVSGDTTDETGDTTTEEIGGTTDETGDTTTEVIGGTTDETGDTTTEVIGGTTDETGETTTEVIGGTTDETGETTTEVIGGTTDETGETTTDGTGETTTTTTLPAQGVKAVEVELIEDVEASNGVYMSHEDSYNAVDLIKSVTIVMEDEDADDLVLTGEEVNAAITFATTPGEDYASIDESAEKKVFVDKVAISYTANPDIVISEEKYPTVAVALKGDTDLNGKVELNDSYLTLMYDSMIKIDKYTPFTETVDGEIVDPLMEKLVYYVSDVDTESKAGKNVEDGAEISLQDAYNILQKNSYDRINQPITWEDLLKKD